jgi:DNA-binding HxlR family transcriptional regulator
MATRGGVTGTDRAARGVNGTAHDANGAVRPGKMPSREANGNGSSSAPERGRSHLEARDPCCSLYHRAIELVGKRWSGAILLVLLGGPLNFSGIRELVPDLSDRLLSERLKELEAEGIVERRVLDTSPPRVEYAVTPKGRALEPAIRALKSWAHRYLA